jgi:hypothetical protein
VNAIAHWTDAAVATYRRRIIPWYYNPGYDIAGASGDCECGWTCRTRVGDYEHISPHLHAKLKELERRAIDAGHWAYGTRPDQEMPTNNTGDMPADSLCSNCQLRLPGI